ncbi:MAG: hypothetical protein LDLANPLL_01039 [Turneriella sp.]|nr:hypothetical protein [Turneriella sp.]
MTTTTPSSVELTTTDEPPQLCAVENLHENKNQLTCTVNSALEVRRTKFGKGVFARKRFKPGDIILRFKGRLYSREAYLSKVRPEKCYYMQIDDNLFLGPTTTADNYVNHCCEPNAGVRKQKNKCFLVAINPIEIGAEITFDYSTTMAEDHWEMDCACGSPSCRGRIRDFKYLPRSLQYHYITLEIAPDFVVRAAGLNDINGLFGATSKEDSNIEIPSLHVAHA